MISIKHTEGVAFIELNAPPVNALWPEDAAGAVFGHSRVGS